MGIGVTELTRRITVTLVEETGEVIAKTDIDIVVSLGAETLLQVKRSAKALGSLNKVKEWVAKAAAELGTTDYSRIKYVVPTGVTIPRNIRSYFNRADINIEVIRIPHL